MLGPLTYGAVSQVTTVEWYLSGGAPTPQAAYSFKGAASQAASYVNLVNPGTYDLTAGVAPTWNTSTGLIFNGSTHYLTTGLNPGSTSWSIVIRYLSATTSQRVICGCFRGATRFFIAHEAIGAAGNVRYANGGQLDVAPAGGASGVLGIAGNQGYRNGSADGGAIGTGSVPTGDAIYLGAANSSGSPGFYFIGTVSHFAIWNTSTSAAVWMPAVQVAVAAL